MPADGDALTFQDKLRNLIATVYPRSQGRPYTLTEIANGIQSMGGEVKYDNLKLLYDGKRARPSLAVVNDICRFFGVKLDYFADGAREPEVDAYAQELALAHVLADAGVVGVAFRARGLSPDNVAFLQKAADHLRGLQGLDPVGDSPDSAAPDQQAG
jgi:hypothetical protein